MSTRFFPLTLIVLGVFAVSASAEQKPTCYDATSVEGSSSIVAEYGANVAKAFGNGRSMKTDILRALSF